VIAANQKNGRGPEDLHRQDENRCLGGELTAVNQVAKEEIFGVGRRAHLIQNAKKIENLAVKIANDDNVLADCEEGAFGLEDRLEGGEEVAEIGEGEEASSAYQEKKGRNSDCAGIPEMCGERRGNVGVRGSEHKGNKGGK
jgi:hypothetical protein